MKRIDIFCASQASTAICLSMQQDQASSSSSINLLGGRAIDRHNPIIRDGRRKPPASASATITAPCSSDPPPINPKPYHQLQRTTNKKKSSTSSSSSTSTDHKKKKSSSRNSKPIPNGDVTVLQDCYYNQAMPPAGDIKQKKKQLMNMTGGDYFITRASTATTTAPGSSRYLLSDSAFFDGLPDYDPLFALVPDHHIPTPAAEESFNNHKAPGSLPPKSSPSPTSEKPPSDQVVVLRVSLHCKGCEGKVRKHLSRMKGVTSFNIDLKAKKVTVVGDVTPLSVLASISKVKNAQFWPVPAPAPSSTAVSGNPKNIT